MKDCIDKGRRKEVRMNKKNKGFRKVSKKTGNYGRKQKGNKVERQLRNDRGNKERIEWRM